MNDPFGNDQPLAGAEFEALVLQIDTEFALQDVEELIVFLMFVPVVFSLYHSQANHGIVNLTEGLVEQSLGVRIPSPA